MNFSTADGPYILDGSNLAAHPSKCPPLEVRIGRGDSVESTHLVDAVVLDQDGIELCAFGNPHVEVFTRSVIKPIQILPYIVSGAFRNASQVERCVSIACASHNAEPEQIATVETWLKELNLSPDALVCGPQRSHDHLRFEKVCNNCSGKHSAMLATCLHKGWDISSYSQWDHPLQREIRRYLHLVSNQDMENSTWGVDGCGLPTYRMPLHAVARAMSVYLHPTRFDSDIQNAISTIRSAQALEPWMISGRGSFDSEILAASHGDIFTKVGAEGNYIGLLYKSKRVIALKARDGAFRAGQAAIFAMLNGFTDLTPTLREKLNSLALPNIRNVAGEPVGEIDVTLS